MLPQSLAVSIVRFFYAILSRFKARYLPAYIFTQLCRFRACIAFNSTN